MASSSTARAMAGSEAFRTRLLCTPDEVRAGLPALEAFQDSLGGVHLWQRPAWVRCRPLDTFWLALTEDGAGWVRAASLWRVRRLPAGLGWTARADRGPVAVDTDALAVHLDQLEDLWPRGLIQYRVSPMLEREAAAPVAAVLAARGLRPELKDPGVYAATIVLDLEPAPDALRAGFRRSLKTQLNKGRRAGVEVARTAEPAAVEAFVALHDAMAARRGLAPLGTAMQSALPRLLAGARSPLTLFIARHGGEVVAGILLVAAGDRIIYEWGATSEAPAHRSLPLSHMLHWEAIQWARSAGFRWYDFGGYWEDRGDSDPINRFKTGFSKTVQRLLPEHVRVRRPLVAGVLRTAVALHRLARR